MFWNKYKKEKSLGQLGEDAAAKFLKKQGYKIVARNFKNKIGRQIGEIDIIAIKKREFIFAEVKTRNLESYGETLPEENITPAKLHKMSKAAHAYLRQNKLLDVSYHFDALSVWIGDDRKLAKIKHLENIFI